ncbi:MAG: hypothetical protein KGI92_12935, partial [Alphaproteobacteria bacterium]|nr:hypothetical protein [Alphaproteobacteria bacterium]
MLEPLGQLGERCGVPRQELFQLWIGFLLRSFQIYARLVAQHFVVCHSPSMSGWAGAHALAARSLWIGIDPSRWPMPQSY